MTTPAVPPRDSRSAPAPLPLGRLGMRLLLLALGMLFAATLTGYLAIRGEAQMWPPPGVPRLPATLWISTLLIVLSSVTVRWAVRSIRRGEQAPLRLGLLLTLLLGVAFLVSQSVNWFSLVAAHFTVRTNLYGFLFYLLTGLHAAHVLGGLAPLGFVTVRAWRGGYTADVHVGVEYVASYWHFLDGVWVVLFAVLTLTS
jgi:cytochrome c oxidase subunit III